MSAAEELADVLVYDGSLEEGLVYGKAMAGLKNKKKKPIKICKLCAVDKHCGYCSCCI